MIYGICHVHWRNKTIVQTGVVLSLPWNLPLCIILIFNFCSSVAVTMLFCPPRVYCFIFLFLYHFPTDIYRFFSSFYLKIFMFHSVHLLGPSVFSVILCSVFLIQFSSVIHIPFIVLFLSLHFFIPNLIYIFHLHLLTLISCAISKNFPKPPFVSLK
jgi:hypothetical protein